MPVYVATIGRPFVTQVEIKMFIMPLNILVMSIVILIIQVIIPFLNNNVKIVQNSGSPEGVM